MALDPEARQFAQTMAEHEKRLRRLETGTQTTQLTHSSIEDGVVPAYDNLGKLRQMIGKQSDGTFAVTYANGDPPPTPSAPTVTARQLSVLVYWDGEFAGDVARPADLQRVDVHMSTTAGFTPDGTTLVGSLVGEGAILLVADNSTHYVRLVSVTVADVASAPTDEQDVVPLAVSQLAAGSVGADELAAEIILASKTITSGDPNGVHVDIAGGTISLWDGDTSYVSLESGNEPQLAFYHELVGFPGAYRQIGYIYATWDEPSQTESLTIGTDVNPMIRINQDEIRFGGTSGNDITFHEDDGYFVRDTWHDLVLQNSWVHRPGFLVPGYRLTPWGDVELCGTMWNGVTANGTVIATLPVGYRPSATTGVPILESASTVAILDVNTDGTMQITSASGTISMNGLFIPIDR